MKGEALEPHLQTLLLKGSGLKCLGIFFHELKLYSNILPENFKCFSVLSS